METQRLWEIFAWLHLWAWRGAPIQWVSRASRPRSGLQANWRQGFSEKVIRSGKVSEISCADWCFEITPITIDSNIFAWYLGWLNNPFKTLQHWDRWSASLTLSKLSKTHRITSVGSPNKWYMKNRWLSLTFPVGYSQYLDLLAQANYAPYQPLSRISNQWWGKILLIFKLIRIRGSSPVAFALYHKLSKRTWRTWYTEYTGYSIESTIILSTLDPEGINVKMVIIPEHEHTVELLVLGTCHQIWISYNNLYGKPSCRALAEITVRD